MSDKLPFEFFLSPEFGADPYAVYAGLRAEGPVHAIDFPPGASAFVVVDYEHARPALNDPRLSKNLASGPEWFREAISQQNPVLGDNMLMSDPPDHTRLRRVVSKAFTPRRIERLRPRVQAITDELIDAFEGDTVELIDAFAFPLPIIVICELLGVPDRDRADFRRWSGALVTPAVNEELARSRDEASDALRAYFTRLIAERRAAPTDDLVSVLVTSDELSEREVLSTLALLLIAGHETTVNLIGNGMLALLRNPDQLDLLRAKPELLPNAIEEFLRYDAPVERATFRIALEDMEIAGTPIPKGSFVHISIGAAGRDPKAFDRAESLDVAREDNRHVGFGHGLHFCLGAPLARMEGQIAFGSLLARLGDIRLACPEEQLSWRFSGSILRSLAALPIAI
ncbi:cytochrome P450 family protein [Nonomuraea dietziae]|uniref:Cytochrome P450 n=1 Tax=Nonomuraea dietziae TaxID=65515 RepID=M4JZX9_9ACTN|nr:cytochrome P450 [Nonomuraea dietziae]AGE14542.1 cytochrome P450 hydroxylase sb3-1 [Nonomuraea dietziae]MBB3733683.1 cytochrome P450 [Nonomuraea dietziae]